MTFETSSIAPYSKLDYSIKQFEMERLAIYNQFEWGEYEVGEREEDGSMHEKCLLYNEITRKIVDWGYLMQGIRISSQN